MTDYRVALWDSESFRQMPGTFRNRAEAEKVADKLNSEHPHIDGIYVSVKIRYDYDPDAPRAIMPKENVSWKQIGF